MSETKPPSFQDIDDCHDAVSQTDNLSDIESVGNNSTASESTGSRSSHSPDAADRVGAGMAVVCVLLLVILAFVVVPLGMTKNSSGWSFP